MTHSSRARVREYQLDNAIARYLADFTVTPM
jgi:hypothetical protein